MTACMISVNVLETYRRYVARGAMNTTKEKILLKALQYFTENDYEGASLNKIAHAIGITKGGIYHYFGSKDELFHECLVFMFSAIRDISMAMVSREMTLEEFVGGLFSFEELFDELARMFKIDLLVDYFNFAYLMFSGIKKFPDLKVMIGGIYTFMIKELEKALLRFQGRKEIKAQLDCNALAFELGSMMEGAMLVAGLDKDFDLPSLGSIMAENVLYMIKA